VDFHYFHFQSPYFLVLIQYLTLHNWEHFILLRLSFISLSWFVIELWILFSCCGLPSLEVSGKEVIWSNVILFDPGNCSTFCGVLSLVMCTGYLQPCPILSLSVSLLLLNMVSSIFLPFWMLFELHMTDSFLIIASCQWNIVICCLLSFATYNNKKNNLHWMVHLYVEYIMMESAIYSLDHLLHFQWSWFIVEVYFCWFISVCSVLQWIL